MAPPGVLHTSAQDCFPLDSTSCVDVPFRSVCPCDFALIQSPLHPLHACEFVRQWSVGLQLPGRREECRREGTLLSNKSPNKEIKSCQFDNWCDKGSQTVWANTFGFFSPSHWRKNNLWCDKRNQTCAVIVLVASCHEKYATNYQRKNNDLFTFLRDGNDSIGVLFAVWCDQSSEYQPGQRWTNPDAADSWTSDEI